MDNYGELKSTIQKYLWNRKDLIPDIPGFISLAERKIYRQLRIPVMEKLLDYDPPEPTEGEQGYAQLELPGDFLEAKFLLAGNRPLTRISDIKIKMLLNSRPAPGLVEQFARIGNRLYLWPVSDDSTVVFSLAYWQDLSGTLVADSDTHDVLRVAPDLYIYGACLEAAPYLVADDRIPVWQSLWKDSMTSLTEFYKDSEYAGSNVAVSNAYGDGSTSVRSDVGYY